MRPALSRIGPALVLVGAFLSGIASAQDRSTFTVGSATAGRGQKATGVIAVPAGTDAALVTDFFGKIVQEARAPEPGVVLFINAVPTMTKGGNIASIGVLARQPPAAGSGR